MDVYAAVKEALNSTNGVQVVQIRALPHPQDGRIDVKWITQREFPFQGFNVYRALDANGAPGTFTQINASLILPSGHSGIEGLSNRTPYLLVDNDAALAIGATYWYQVEWIDLGSVSHLEPPVPADYGELARVATARYSIVHNAVDNDLTVRIGEDFGYSPGALGGADFEVLGPGEGQQDSAHVVLGTPPNTGTSTVGTIEHFWSVGFNAGDPAESYLPPRRGWPWFLYVKDAGYVNRTGRVTSFSIFVNDFPGSANGTTYVTDHSPMPVQTGEFGQSPAVLWIPEQGTVAVGDPAPAPKLTFLRPSIPNPITGRAVFRYAVGREVARGPVNVSLRLHDLQGRLVRNLTGAQQGPGDYEVGWDGRDDGGTRVVPGIYYLRLSAGGVRSQQKIAVLD